LWCSIRCLGGVVTRGRVILWSFGVVGWSSVSSGTKLVCLGGLVNRSLGLVVAGSRVTLGFLGIVN
jgi:hypothetical protein